MSGRPLRVAIVHYHLRRGGVTRIIEHTLRGLPADRVQACALCGEPPPVGFSEPSHVAVVDGLGYDTPPRKSITPEVLADRMQTAASVALGGKAPELWHIHNHSLGKNIAMPGAVCILAKTTPVLLHVHDFAEDGRPEQYTRLLKKGADGRPSRAAARLYPIAPQIEYAVLNRRDQHILGAAGIPAERIHLLQNPVVDAHAPSPPQPDAAPPMRTRLFLYPTRAIRRKNLGELLLWATTARPSDRFAVTLAPENPAERPAYDHWTALAAELNLPIEFEMGTRPGASLDRLLASATATLTTSIAEGFGLAFLEPWLAGRPVLGRNLPEITSDFNQAGIHLDALYDRLLVPLELVGREPLRCRMAEALASMLAAYGRTPAPDAAERALAAAVEGDHVDFGRLDATMQEHVIRRARHSADVRHALRPSALWNAAASRAVDRNRALILSRFNLPAYAGRLVSIYHGLAGTPPAHIRDAASGPAILDAFLAPERLHLLTC